MKSTTFKRCLNLTLVISLSLSTAAPLSMAQAQTSSNSNDPIVLLVAAMKEESPERAKELLAKAKIELQKEKLSDESMRKLEAFLHTVEQTISQHSSQKQKGQLAGDTKPIGFSFDNKGQVVTNSATSTPTPTPAPVTASEMDELQKLLQENPALRDSMREIGKGRVERDANQLQTTMPTQIADQTKKDVAQATAQDTPNAWVQTLLNSGLIIKNAAELNATLRDTYEGVPTDFLADRIIKEYTWYAGATGGVKYIASKIQDNQLLTKAGIVGEAGATFIMNTNMILRLIDLYGLKLSSANQEVMITSIMTLFKAGAQIGVNSKEFRETVGQAGKLFMKAALTKSQDAMKKYLSIVLNHPFVLKLATNHATKMIANNVASMAMEALTLTLHVGLSAMETYQVGQLAKVLIKSALTTEREASNESVRQLLMSTKGKGFLKLLILSMNVGSHIPSFTKPEKADNAKVRFILNLARATKRCSPEEKATYDKTLAKQQTLAKKVKGTATTLTSFEARTLRYACDTNLNQDEYKQLIQEFSTLNSIPQSLVTSLRLEKYGRRVRLGEIIYQLMFLDGDIDDDELAFFNGTVAKMLGLDILTGLSYFDKFHSFIVDHNGMVKSLASPTGYAIGADASDNPYDLSIGFTTPGGPQLTTQQAQSQ